MKRSEIQGRINACNNELQQCDYTGRKVAFEVAKAFKVLHPDVNMPVLDQYIEGEAEADARRAEIAELQAKLDNGDYEEDDM